MPQAFRIKRINEVASVMEAKRNHAYMCPLLTAFTAASEAIAGAG
jgi:hypothetical protein